MNKLFPSGSNAIIKKPLSNITVNQNGGVELNLKNPETTRKLLDIVDAFRNAKHSQVSGK